MNRDYLLGQLRLIDDYLLRARRVAGRPREEFLADKIFVDAAVREIVVLFETCHNVGKHVIGESKWREAESKAEVFEILADHGVIERARCDALTKAARFRNLATYQTVILDDEIVYDILTHHVNDFEAFAADVANWLAQVDSADFESDLQEPPRTDG